YKIARRALPEGVSNEIYFYALHKEKGVFVFDQLARENVLKKCKSRAIEIPHSPLLALSQLSCFTIPSKDAVAQELVPKDETRSFDPLVIKSARTELGFPQFILFGDSHLTAQPLVGREGGLVKGEKWLMVAYPTDLRSEIEPRISLIREEFLIIQDIKKKNLTSGSESKMKRAWDATELKPGAFGVRFDLKKYLRKR
ncbi:MAG: hypothetical protein K0U54_02345, partial [Bacteroidetes bacterium]|nr:hypothetical protein [Bacteroidota bacterium]